VNGKKSFYTTRLVVVAGVLLSTYALEVFYFSLIGEQAMDKVISHITSVACAVKYLSSGTLSCKR
jgi:hypothetical protein